MIGKRKHIRMKLRSGARNPKQLASCHGKIRYDKKAAHTEADNKPANVKAYKCKFCAYYHVGRQQGKLLI